MKLKWKTMASGLNSLKQYDYEYLPGIHLGYYRIHESEDGFGHIVWEIEIPSTVFKDRPNKWYDSNMKLSWKSPDSVGNQTDLSSAPSEVGLQLLPLPSLVLFWQRFTSKAYHVFTARFQIRYVKDVCAFREIRTVLLFTSVDISVSFYFTSCDNRLSQFNNCEEYPIRQSSFV